jgi:hypothetical protein
MIKFMERRDLDTEGDANASHLREQIADLKAVGIA